MTVAAEHLPENNAAAGKSQWEIEKRNIESTDTRPQMSDYFMSWPLDIAEGQEHKSVPTG